MMNLGEREGAINRSESEHIYTYIYSIHWMELADNKENKKVGQENSNHNSWLGIVV